MYVINLLIEHKMKWKKFNKTRITRKKQIANQSKNKQKNMSINYSNKEIKELKIFCKENPEVLIIEFYQIFKETIAQIFQKEGALPNVLYQSRVI